MTDILELEQVDTESADFLDSLAGKIYLSQILKVWQFCKGDLNKA